MKRWIAVMLVLIAVFLPGSAHASDPPVWGAPVQIGVDLPSSWFPDIDVDPTGKIRLVWGASLVEGDLNETHALAGGVMIAEETDAGWSEPSDIFVMDGGIASRPMIASDGAWVHLLFRYAPPGVPVRVVYSRAPAGADLHNTHSWSDPVKLSDDESYWAQLRVLPSGDLVILYNQMTVLRNDGVEQRLTALYSRRSIDGGLTWSHPIRISASTEHVARTTLAVGLDGNHLLAAWDVGYDNMSATGDPSGLATAVSSDGGVSWSDPWTTATEVEQSVVATDGKGALLVYRSTSDDRLFYRSSDDGGMTWSEQEAIDDARARPYSNKHNFDRLSLAIDGDGRFLLSWVGTDDYAPMGLSVMVATWDGLEWTPPEVIASPDGYPEYPRIAVALGNNLRIAYFVRDNAFDVGHYTLWVVDGTSNAKAVEPADVEPAPPIVPSPRIIPTPDIYVAATPPPAPTAVQGTIVLNRTPQSVNTQPMRTIVIISTGGLAATLLVVGAVRWLLRS